MAKNKITFETEWLDGRNLYHFTGSQRQPTLVEAYNFLVENRLFDQVYDCFGVAITPIYDNGWVAPEDVLTLTLYGYDGGLDDGGNCPICGHEREVSGDICPVCRRKWNE